MTRHGMSHAVFQRQHHDFVLGEVVFGKLDLAVENGEQVFGFQLLRLAIRPVAFQAERSSCSRRAADARSLRREARWQVAQPCLNAGWWRNGFLPCVGDVAMATQADFDGIGFGQPRLTAGMRAVAIGAIARGSRMRNFGAVDQLGFVVVAGHAERLDIGLRQDHFSVFGRCVADFALLFGERRMRELCQQLGSGRLVRIVTAHAVGLRERLVLVRFLQVGALYVVTIDAQRRRSFGQMKVELHLAGLARFVGGVAGVAAHVEGGVAAALLRDVDADLVAAQAEILLLVSRLGLQQLILVVRGVRIVTLQAVANGRGMNRASSLVEMSAAFLSAWQVRQSATGVVVISFTRVMSAIDPNLVAGGASHGDCGVNRLALGLVLVARQAGGGIRLRIERDRMLRGERSSGEQKHGEDTDQRRQPGNSRLELNDSTATAANPPQ